MRKRLVPYRGSSRADAQWIDLSEATAEVTSEDPDHPIENALLGSDERGWRAAEPGVQQVRVVFDAPRAFKRIRLEFLETQTERTQEFVLSWSAGDAAVREIVRQQWNFSPGGAVLETEDYEVQLTGLHTLELTVNPDISGKLAYASLRRLCLA